MAVKTAKRPSHKHHRSSEQDLRAFGALVARKRMEKGFTSQQLADKIGISLTGLSRIENGNREPRFEIIKRLAGHLDIIDGVVNYLKGGKFNE